VKESGKIFAVPTYLFIISMFLMIVTGLYKATLGGGLQYVVPTAPVALEATGAATIVLVLHAFASGGAAMTGVEAISNGVQAFKKPAAKNASQTLIAMGLVLGFLFMGSSLLARHFGIVPHEDNTVLSQLGGEAYGDGSVLFALLNIMTAGILILAANTSFADFPRLSAILARDGYMPRIFHARGNRLVFSYGIIALAVLASGLLIGFDAKTTRLIPLYALGVFLSFTLSQAGMVRHWLKSKDEGWRRSIAVNGLGAVTTAVVFAVILEAKFAEGAWVVCILIPLLSGVALLIGRFYKGLKRSLHVAPEAILELEPAGSSRVPVVVPVEDINLATVMALGAACQRHREVTALHVVVDPDEPSTVPERWKHQFPGIPLVVIESPYRSVAEPIAAYLDDRVRSAPHEVSVLVPILEVPHWFQRPLVNQSLKRLNGLLSTRRRVRVERFPFPIGSTGRRKRLA